MSTKGNKGKLVIGLEAFVAEEERSYLAYASLTLAGRSFPHIQDGLKPVMRRALYAFDQLGMTNKTGYKKSARIVGDVIGKYHPHGDDAVYKTMVGMAQSWKYRYLLVDGQGNWGSRDGDSPAAMRYTESRPSVYADFMQQELSKHASRFKPNFDNTTYEPEYLPIPFPNILCNGGFGIGVGMICGVPSHNISDVVNATIHFVENPDCTVADLMLHIKAPDFATGGCLANSEKELLSMYETGKGKLRVKPTWDVEKRSHGQYVIYINELPKDISAVTVITRIDDILMYDPKGDEAVNAKKIDKRSFLRSHIEAITDISDAKVDAKEARLLIVPKVCSKSPEEFMDLFISALDLEVKIIVEMNLMSIDYRPRRRNLKSIISDWVQFRRDTIIRRSKARINKIESRLEIVNGRLAIMGFIDEVIVIIRGSENPKTALIDRFDVTERQAMDILDIKLRELASLEELKLRNEEVNLSKELKSLMTLIASKSKLGKLLIKEMMVAESALRDERRTKIEPSDELKFEYNPKSNNKDPVTLFITDQGWLISRKGHNVEPPDKMLKPDDVFSHVVEVVGSDDMILLSSSGRSFTVPVESFPVGATSTHINTIVNVSTDKIVAAFPFVSGDKYLLCQNYGLGFVTSCDSLHSRQKNGKDVFKLTKFDDAKIILVEKLKINPNGGFVGNLNIQTSENRFMQFDLSSEDGEIREYPKSQGVQLCKLSKKKNELISFYGISPAGFVTKDGAVELDVGTYVKKRAGTPVRLK